MHTKTTSVGALVLTLIALATLAALSAPNLTSQTLGGFSNGNGSSSNGGTQMTSGILGQWVQGTSTGGTSSVTAGFLPAASSKPLAVTLGYFHAVRADGIIHVNWQTATEAGVAGFRLYGEANGTRTLLTEELVPSTVVDAVTPTSYSLRVTGDAARFLLEEVGVDGSATLHGPFDEGVEYGEYLPTANVELEPAIYLPVVTGE